MCVCAARARARVRAARVRNDVCVLARVYVQECACVRACVRACVCVCVCVSVSLCHVCVCVSGVKVRPAAEVTLCRG